MPVQHSFQSSYIIFCCIIGASLSRHWTRPTSCSLGFSSRSRKQYQRTEHGEVGPGPWLHLYNIILVDFLLVSSVSGSLFRISAAWIFPQKSSSRVENNRNSRTWFKCFCVRLKESFTLNAVTQPLAACFTWLGPFSSLTYVLFLLWINGQTYPMCRNGYRTKWVSSRVSKTLKLAIKVW